METLQNNNQNNLNKNIFQNENNIGGRKEPIPAQKINLSLFEVN